MKQTCKIANSEEGMEKLFEHTLQRQVAEQSKEIGELKGQIAELAALLKGGAPSTANSSTNTNSGTQTLNQIRTQNNMVTSQTTINISPWGREIYFSAQALEAAFAESETLQRYCHIGYKARADAEEAAPYVQEALMSLVKRVHQDPQERNVYLNPKRTDQVLIYDEATWQVLPLVEAIRSLFDRVSRRIHKVTSPTGTEWQKLSPAVAESAPWLPIMYDERREEHIVRARPSMAAHLENMAPGRATLGPAARLVQPQELVKEKAVYLLEDRPKEPKKEESQKAERPAPFTMYEAAGLLRAVKITAGEGWASSASRLQEGSKGQDQSRIMTKLWEAMEEGLLSEMEGLAVRELVTEYDRAAMAMKQK